MIDTVCLVCSLFTSLERLLLFIQMRDWFPTWLGGMRHYIISVRLRHKQPLEIANKGQTRENSQSINFILYGTPVYTLLVLIELIIRRRQKTDSFKWREFLNMVLKWYHTILSIWRAWEDSIELAFSSTESIIAARRFSEFIAEPASHPIAYVLLHVVVVANRIMQH